MESDRPIRQFGSDGRDYSIDILRCFSCWMVILVHAINMLVNGRYGAPEIVPGSFDYNLCVILKACLVSATTLFVMVSGVFFLTPSRNVTPKKIWTKNIPKLAAAYVFWTFLYAAFKIITEGNVSLSWTTLSERAFDQPYHLWYIPMLISLYIVAPFLRLITANADRKLFQYGITILIISSAIITLTLIPEIPYYDRIYITVARWYVVDLCSYAWFFILGYYLYTFRPKAATRRIIYVLGILSVTLSAGYCIIMTNNGVDGIWDYHFFAKQSITTFGKNTAIFVFFMTVFHGVRYNRFVKKTLLKLSNCTLIIYLVHIMILELFSGSLYSLGWDPVITVVILSLIAYFAGFILAWMFQMIPWKKIIDNVTSRGGKTA